MSALRSHKLPLPPLTLESLTVHAPRLAQQTPPTPCLLAIHTKHMCPSHTPPLTSLPPTQTALTAPKLLTLCTPLPLRALPADPMAALSRVYCSHLVAVPAPKLLTYLAQIPTCPLAAGDAVLVGATELRKRFGDAAAGIALVGQ